jgi:hypothetical protein
VQRASGVPHALYGRKIHQRLGRITSRECEAVSAIGSLKTESVTMRYARTRHIFSKFALILESLGGSLANIVETTEYIVSLDDYENFSRAFGAMGQVQSENALTRNTAATNQVFRRRIPFQACGITAGR